jgi:hypothetical protein
MALKYVDNSLFQVAGEIGLVSLGLEKHFYRYSVGGLYGWVPAEISGGPAIETVTLRQTYRFYEWKRFDFYSGLNIYHVLGLGYRTSEFKDSPKRYYPIGGIRALLNLGFNLHMRPGKDVFYFEVGINDIWVENSFTNYEEMNPLDHTSMGIGFKHYF